MTYTGEVNEEWVECARCHYPMLPLNGFEVQAVSEMPQVEFDWIFLLFFGWTLFVGKIVVNCVSGMLTFEKRKREILAAKSALLPQYPNSLVFPKCQNIVKRK
jgi:hypothetical protein